MRTRNGLRGLHEFLSGTRVIKLPARERRRQLQTEQLDDELSRPAEVPQRIGGYTIRGVLRWESDAKLLLGDDAALGRQVVIHFRPLTDQPLFCVRQQLTRPTRLRWVGGGRHEDQQWDAFLAPSGKSLPGLVHENDRLPWPEVRAILEQLATELTAATKDGTLPVFVGVDQIRVQSNGSIQLLDWPLQTSAEIDSQEDCEVSPDLQGLALLRQAAVLALENRSWHPDEAKTTKRFRHQPLPLHADLLLARLLGYRKPLQSVEEFEKELAVSRDRPAEVTRARRAAQVALFSVFIYIAMAGCMLPAGVGPSFITVLATMAVGEAEKAALKELEQGAWRDFVVASVNPDPQVRLRGIAQLDADLRLRDQLHHRIEQTQSERKARVAAMSSWMRQFVEPMEKGFEHGLEQGKERAKAEEKARQSGNVGINFVVTPGMFRQSAAFAVSSQHPIHRAPRVVAGMLTIGLVFWPLVWVVWAFLCRGGLSFRWTGLALAQSDGRKAARWQCAWRALLVWTPVVVLWTLSVWLEVSYWAAFPAGDPDSWTPWVTWGVCWTGLILLPLYAGLAILYPRRCLHDWLAGTHLVPR